MISEERKYFISYRHDLATSDLLEIQKNSYDLFLKKDLPKLLKEMLTLEDSGGLRLDLQFVKCFLEEPKFDEETCKKRNLTYEAPLRVELRLINKQIGKKKSQVVYLGDIPLMTKRGTFIVNGIERVVVQQLTRSSGVFFTASLIKKTGRKLYGAKVIPERGVWLEFETDLDRAIFVRIDRGRKIIVTALLRIFGLETNEEIRKFFRDKEIEATLEKDPCQNEEDGVKEIYRKIRAGELATTENARTLIHSMFLKSNRYDLGIPGRFKINQRLGFEQNSTSQFLRQEDLIAILKEIFRLDTSQEEPDDIDHLSNRRIRAVGELVRERLRVGLMRLQRIIRDKMSILKDEDFNLGQLISTRPIVGILREFFLTGQLSQFMDQVNPLAELEHKRRFTLTGPGGLSGERAGFEVRDVHSSFYGRICPISTSEGQNAGLVGYLSSYARLNEMGFIETPYFKVKNKKITEEIVYFNAKEEEKHIIAPFTTECDSKNRILEERVEVRIKGEPGLAHPEEIEFIDVGANQILSMATSLVPFLEHDDGARAMMGANMQRQSVPLIKPEAPLVGTGLETVVAKNSGYIILADEDGEIEEVDADHIVLKTKDNQRITYPLLKFARSNFDTCFNQHPIVDKRQKVKRNQALSDGPAIEKDELSLGRNLLVAFMPWGGYNYQDAILISSRLVKEDVLTSIFVKEHVIDVREIRFGSEMTTRDIPNISQEKLSHLDEDGIIIVGSEVDSGDILVGKITPKGEIQLSPEEKLLQAIFGEKAKDVYDSSLYLEHGEHGKVIGAKIFSRDQGDKLSAGVIKSIHILVADLRKIQAGDKLTGRHGNKGVVSKVLPEEEMPYLEDGTPIDIVLNPLGVVSRMNLGQILETHLGLTAKKLGYKAAIPSLNGPGEETIKEELKKAGFPSSGKVKLFDGRTGKPFEREVMVGYIYIMKLIHMVEDKIHQRSIGPYSLITQQPLGGRAQSGGQRFGEMEVWALEGYGAAYTLQEMLTIKSDDIEGRARAYEAIIRGEPIEKISIPESFNVLCRELAGLCLKVEMIKKK